MRFAIVFGLLVSVQSFAQTPTCDGEPRMISDGSLTKVVRDMGKDFMDAGGNFLWKQFANQVIDKPTCKQIIMSLKEAGNGVVQLTDIDCKNNRLKFTVPVLVPTGGSTANCFPVDNPWHKEITDALKDRKPTRFDYKSLTVDFNRAQQELAAKGVAYKYDFTGSITKIFHYGRTGNGTRVLQCEDVDPKTKMDGLFQMNQVAKIVKMFGQKSICDSPCNDELQKYAEENRKDPNLPKPTAAWVAEDKDTSLASFSRCDYQRSMAMQRGCTPPHPMFDRRKCAIPLLKRDGCTPMTGDCIVNNRAPRVRGRLNEGDAVYESM